MRYNDIYNFESGGLIPVVDPDSIKLLKKNRDALKEKERRREKYINKKKHKEIDNRNKWYNPKHEI